jgi:hypothetical protein
LTISENSENRGCGMTHTPPFRVGSLIYLNTLQLCCGVLRRKLTV